MSGGAWVEPEDEWALAFQTPDPLMPWNADEASPEEVQAFLEQHGPPEPPPPPPPTPASFGEQVVSKGKRALGDVYALASNVMTGRALGGDQLGEGRKATGEDFARVLAPEELEPGGAYSRETIERELLAPMGSQIGADIVTGLPSLLAGPAGEVGDYYHGIEETRRAGGGELEQLATGAMAMLPAVGVGLAGKAVKGVKKLFGEALPEEPGKLSRSAADEYLATEWGVKPEPGVPSGAAAAQPFEEAADESSLLGRAGDDAQTGGVQGPGTVGGAHAPGERAGGAGLEQKPVRDTISPEDDWEGTFGSVAHADTIPPPPAESGVRQAQGYVHGYGDENPGAVDYLAEQTGSRGGVTQGGRFRGSDGVERYVKMEQDPTRTLNEHASNQMYRDFGRLAPESELIEVRASAVDPDAPDEPRKALATRWLGDEWVPVRDAAADPSKFTPAVAKDYVRGTVIDIVTGNQDVWGNAGNLMANGQRAFHIDTGLSGANAHPFFQMNPAIEREQWDQLLDAVGRVNSGSIPEVPGHLVNRVLKPETMKALKGDLMAGVADVEKAIEPYGGMQGYVNERFKHLDERDRKALAGYMDRRLQFVRENATQLAILAGLGVSRLVQGDDENDAGYAGAAAAVIGGKRLFKPRRPRNLVAKLVAKEQGGEAPLLRSYSSNHADALADEMFDAADELSPELVNRAEGAVRDANIDKRVFEHVAQRDPIDRKAFVDRVTDLALEQMSMQDEGLEVTDELARYVRADVDHATHQALFAVLSNDAIPRPVRGQGIRVRAVADAIGEDWADEYRDLLKRRDANLEEARQAGIKEPTIEKMRKAWQVDIDQHKQGAFSRAGKFTTYGQVDKAIVGELIDAAERGEPLTIAADDVARYVDDGVMDQRIHPEDSYLAHRASEAWMDRATKDLGYDVTETVQGYAGNTFYKNMNELARKGPEGLKRFVADWQAREAWKNKSNVPGVDEVVSETTESVKRLQQVLDHAVQSGYVLPGQTWRGALMSVDELHRLSNSSEASAFGFMSTSTDPDYAKSFIEDKEMLRENPGLRRVLFEVHQRSGVPMNQSEGEVLLRAGTKFRVQKLKGEGNYARFILTEDDAPTPAPDEVTQGIKSALPWVAGGALVLGAGSARGEDRQ